MRHKLGKWWWSIRDGLWLFPTALVLAGVGLAYLILHLDLRYDNDLTAAHPKVFAVSASGAYSILAAVATSMVTVAGVAFSMTLVALSLAANQYSPRTLRHYMRDRGNQLVLGTLLGTFAYSLVALRMIRSGENPFVPSLGVLAGIALALLSLGMFIYFVQHVSVSLSVTFIISNVAISTISALENLFPADGSERSFRTEIPARPWHDVPVAEMGYLESIDIPRLERYASRRQWVIRMVPRVGDFLAKSEPLLRVCGSGLTAKDVVRLNRMAVIMRFRTVHQDPGFGIRQIVDIALKALSPGINDTTTALTCIDYLGAVLVSIAGRADPSCFHFRDGRLCLITREVDFNSVLEQAFLPIIPNAASNAEALDRLVRAFDRLFDRLPGHAGMEERAGALRALMARLIAAAGRGSTQPKDRESVLSLADSALRRWSDPRRPAA